MNDVVKWNLDTQLQETRSQMRCSCVCVTIFCLTILVVVVAGGTAFYFLHIAPTNSAKNKTNVHDQHLDKRVGTNTGRKNAHVPGCPLSNVHVTFAGECEEGWQCRQREECIAFKEEQSNLDALTSLTPEWYKLFTKLENLKCHGEKNAVCCEIGGFDDFSIPCHFPTPLNST